MAFTDLHRRSRGHHPAITGLLVFGIVALSACTSIGPQRLERDNTAYNDALGETWKRQRRIIDPAFEGRRVRDRFPAMWDASEVAASRIGRQLGGEVEIEAEASHAAADVIFRTLFSIPIDHRIAQQTFEAFRRYQRSQPILNLRRFRLLPILPDDGHQPIDHFLRQDLQGLFVEISPARPPYGLEV